MQPNGGDYRTKNSINQIYRIEVVGGAINPNNIRIKYSANGLSDKSRFITIDHAYIGGITYINCENRINTEIISDGFLISISDITELQTDQSIVIQLRCCYVDWSNFSISNETIEVYYNDVLVQRDLIP